MLECDLLVRAIPAMTDRDVAESREALDGLEESYRKEDISAWGRLNWAFHRRLYEPARRPRTLAMLQAIHLQTERYIRLHLLMTEGRAGAARSEEHTSELQSLMRISYAVFCLKKKNKHTLLPSSS